MNELVSSILVVLVMCGILLATQKSWEPAERPYLWGCLLLHFVAATSMVVITRDVYSGGDLLGYHEFGRVVSSRLADDFLTVGPMVIGLIFQSHEPLPIEGAVVGSSTGSMQGIATVLGYLLNNSLYAECLAMAGATTFATFAIYRVLRHAMPSVSWSRLCVGCLLLPSTIYWSSGLLKEPVALTGLGMMVHGGYRLVAYRRYASGFIWFATGTIMVGLLKGYLLPPFGLAAGAWLIVRGAKQRGSDIFSNSRNLIIGVALAASATILVGALLPRFAPENLAEEAAKLQEIGERVRGGSSYSLGGGEDVRGNQVSLLPLALATVLFRPALFEARSALMLFNSLETTALTILWFMLLARRGIVGTLRAMMDEPGYIFCATFTLGLAVGVGLTTTNLGTLSRYRMPLMPFYAVTLLCLTAPRRTALTDLRVTTSEQAT